MVPDVSHPCWAQFVRGKKQIQCSKPTLGLLIQNNKMSYERDPSPENVRRLIEKAQRFFVQYEPLFGEELAELLK
jgi:hypothetical protein